jgi:hypothetical protein
MTAFDYTTRLPNQFGDSTNLQALVNVCAAMFEESNEILRTLRDEMTIDLAEGVWLDEIGDIVGVARGAGQVDDSLIFAYRDKDESDDPLKAFSDKDDPHGGYYVGIDGLPDGTSFIDADYRLLIRAKVASTYSGDTIPDMWTWIDAVFDTDALVYNSGAGEVAIELSDYLTHTQRRILERYIPRAAGVIVTITVWPPEV